MLFSIFQCRDFIKEGALKKNTPADVVQACDVTISCISDPAAVKDVSIFFFVPVHLSHLPPFIFLSYSSSVSVILFCCLLISLFLLSPPLHTESCTHFFSSYFILFLPSPSALIFHLFPPTPLTLPFFFKIFFPLSPTFSRAPAQLLFFPSPSITFPTLWEMVSPIPLKTFSPTSKFAPALRTLSGMGSPYPLFMLASCS